MPELIVSDPVRRLVANLPPFSPIAVKLLGIVSDENASFKEVAKLLSLDPALSGQVLRVANSGMFGRRVPIQSVLHAIAMLGLRVVSQIAITAAISHGLPRRTSAWTRSWWRHSIAAALISNYAGSGKLGFDFGYTGGLLHAIGQLALFQHVPDDYPRIVDAAYADDANLLEREHERFGVDHAALGGLILAEWGLPVGVQEAVAAHHSHADSYHDSEPLTSAVQIGCWAAEHKGFGQCGCADATREESLEFLPEGLIDYLSGLATEVNRMECSLI